MGKNYKVEHKKIFGEHTMNHGSTRFPNEYFMLDLITDVTSRQKAVLLGIMAANSFEREQKHLPAYISQEKLGFRVGVSQPMISMTYKQLKKKEFNCPFCEYTRKGYIRVEKVKRRTRLNPWGADHVWTDGYKEIINHLCMHYQEYHDRYGSEEAQDIFIMDALEKLKEQPEEEEQPMEIKFGPPEGDF